MVAPVSCTKPRPTAFFTSNCLPSMRNGNAVCRPNKRTIRTIPPPPGNKPKVTSGRPNLVFGSAKAMRRCVASAISQPPPSAVPFNAATTGFPSVSMVRISAFSASRPVKNSCACSGCILMISSKSPPAKKVFFAEVMMTPARSVSAFNFAVTSCRLV